MVLGIKMEKFDADRYQKVMSFLSNDRDKNSSRCKTNRWKIIRVHKVTPAIAYYRNVEAYKDVFSPNRFPFANSIEELFDFCWENFKELSKKPSWNKNSISSDKRILNLMQKR